MFTIIFGKRALIGYHSIYRYRLPLPPARQRLFIDLHFQLKCVIISWIDLLDYTGLIMNYDAEETIILVGPDREVLQDFDKTLASFVPRYKTKDVQLYSGKELLQANLDFSRNHAKCFLEIRHICVDKNGEWHRDRAFIVLYQNKNVTNLYDGDEISVWWNCGPQKELKQFAEADQLISFKELNERQKEAIVKFLGYEKIITQQPTSQDIDNEATSPVLQLIEETCTCCLLKVLWTRVTATWFMFDLQFLLDRENCLVCNCVCDC
ncbi:uncharacterized protein LOC134183657 isoform X2 [Corticium candelabrum]|uniref:uncharacterized protein LOC134183657 isoform X2 n=1 Tax=Corticium candelabrum TaxID=121492 RepID=UPI002E261892|nr:uncharacterized protein LOC134183657 isoform X2 [Corticium candelabrum]